MLNLFAVTIFLSAFLLFQIQPMMAKFILPWFGGGPGVWTVCLLFFQVCLLAGYAYAHAISHFFSRRTQVIVHVVLLVAALFFLPIAPSARWGPELGVNPTWRILLMLTFCLGLPYFVLASTGTLLQAWFSRVHSGVSPYRLYALSNAGSLLALVSYPFLFEPVFTRRTQAGLWSWGFGGFVLLCGTCAWQLWRSGAREMLPVETEPADANQKMSARPTLVIKAWWFVLPACGSVLLLATNKIVPRHAIHSVFVGAAAEPLPADFHYLFRPAGLVPAEDPRAPACSAAGLLVPHLVRGFCRVIVITNPHLWR